MKKFLLLLAVFALGSQLSAQGLVSDLTVQRTVKFTGDITPSQITSNQNDYDPATLSTAAIVRISSDAARSITGLAGGVDGRVIVIVNVGSFAITLSNESGSSTAANRFGFGADQVLASKNSTLLIYDSTATRWRAAGAPADLSALNASNLTSGTVPDARFPSSIPITGHGLFTEGSAPSTPAANKVALYAKSDGLLYSKDDAGVETQVSNATSSGGTVTHTGGALTSNRVVLGAGTDDVKVAAGFATDGTSKLTLGEAGTSVGGLLLANATSGTVELRPTTGALGSSVITVPAATDTIGLLAASQTFTNKTLTSPKIGTSILDTNGNEFFNLTATGSAVNEITFANSATGNNPSFTASGGDSDVGINFVMKGAGTMKLDTANQTGILLRLNNSGSTSGSQQAVFQVGFSDSRRFIIGTAGGAVGSLYNDWNYIYSEAGNGMRLIAYSGKPITFVTLAGLTESMRLTENGNLTLGTTSETGLSGGGGLRVASTTASTNTTTGATIISGGLGVAGQIYAAGIQNTPIGGTTPSTGAFTSLTGSSGGITSASGAAWGITAGGTSQQSYIYLVARSTAPADVNWYLVNEGGVDSDIFHIKNTSATNEFSITQAGAIRFNAYGAGTATFDSSGNITSVSDARAKNTIAPFTTGLAAVRQLQPKKYHWKPETGLNPDDINVAIYAQDLIAAGIPEAVSMERTVESKNTAGSTVRTRVPASYYTVSDRVVLSALINAVKELAAKNDALELRLATLEADAKKAK